MAHSTGGTSTSRAWAEGGVIFAASMLMIMGIYQIFMGIAAIARNQFFVVAPNYVYEIDTTVWGWVHLGIGVIATITGFFLFTQATWARWLGIAMAGLSAVANFFFLTYYPLWSLVLIAMDIFVIWSLSTIGNRATTPMWGDAAAGAQMPMAAGMPMTGAGMPMTGAGMPMSGGPMMGAPTAGTPEGAMAGRWPANPPTGPSYDTAPSKGMAQPAEAESAEAMQAEQMAGQAPPRPPAPSP